MLKQMKDSGVVIVIDDDETVHVSLLLFHTHTQQKTLPWP